MYTNTYKIIEKALEEIQRLEGIIKEQQETIDRLKETGWARLQELDELCRAYEEELSIIYGEEELPF